jgi:hypothetical protein
MLGSKKDKYYIDEEIRLLKTQGGNKRTGHGGLVVQSQKALTCRTCFAVIGANHLDNHIKQHTIKPAVKGDAK